MNTVIKGDFTEYTGKQLLSTNREGHHTFIVNNIDVRGAKEISVQFVNGEIKENGVISGGNSNNVTMNIYGSLGSEYTTNPIGIINNNVNSSDVIFTKTGFYFMKFRIINNDTASSSIVSYKVLVKN